MINPKQPVENDYNYHINLCTRDNSKSTCLSYYDPENGGDECYACLQTTGTYYYSYRLGVTGDMNYFEDEITGEYGVKVSYTGGDWIYCPYLPVPDYSVMVIEIKLTCVGDYGEGSLVPSEPLFDDICTFHFEWTTEYACRLCTLDDYQLLNGDCVKGKRNQTYVLRTDISTCMHGLSKFY
jgi:uncharacterized protein YuzB (UPF0349 family)